jgi:hypothetical protein
MDGGTAASSPSNKLGSSHGASNPLLLSHHDGETGVGVGFVVALFDHGVMKGIFITALPCMVFVFSGISTTPCHPAADLSGQKMAMQ